MALVRTFHLPHYEAYPVHVALFEDVQNAEFLKSQLLAANPEFDYAFLDASMILSPSHLLTSTFLTLHSFSSPLTSRPKTRTPHSELVFRLSPNNNIGQSYKLFGISAATTSLIAVKLAVRVVSGDAEGGNEDGPKGKLVLDESITAERVSKHLGAVVQGRSVEVSEGGGELGRVADVERIRGVYKLGDMGGVKKGKGGKSDPNGVVKGGPVRDETKELESVILGVMSLKGS